MAMSYDNRKPSDAAVMAWGEASSRSRWTFSEAVEAIHEHYAGSKEFLMPAHITIWIKAKRQDALMRQPVEQPDPAGQARLAKMISGAFRDVDEPAPGELQWIHDAVSAVPCPRCDAPTGKRCVNPVNGRIARVPCLARTRSLNEEVA